MDYSVKYKVEIENFSDQPLELVRSEIHSGYLHNPPAPVIMPGKRESYNAHKVEIVMNELRKNKNFHFDSQIHPTLLNSTYLHCQMTGFIPIGFQNFLNVE